MGPWSVIVGNPPPAASSMEFHAGGVATATACCAHSVIAAAIVPAPPRTDPALLYAGAKKRFIALGIINATMAERSFPIHALYEIRAIRFGARIAEISPVTIAAVT